MEDTSMEGSKLDEIFNFVFNVGYDIPIKNPKTIPTKVVRTSLIPSLGFLLVELRVLVPIMSKLF
jgi:uncharacterized membrane protein